MANFTSTHNFNNTTFTIKFINYNKVSTLIENAVLQTLDLASASLALPAELNINIVNSSCHGEWAYYAHKGTNPIKEENPTIVIYMKRTTLIHAMVLLGHELGHAEHYFLYPESAKWTRARKENYANCVMKFLDTSVQIQDCSISEDVWVAGGLLHRNLDAILAVS